MATRRYDMVVLGLSAGGMEALKTLIPALPGDFPLPVVIAQHVAEDTDGFLIEYLARLSQLPLKEAEDKEPIADGHIYFAPAGYHLLIEDNRSFSLSVDPRVNHSCPSIDVLFDSASDACRGNLIGVVLTGANSDGSKGLKNLQDRGGCAIVQNPASADSSAMPQAALQATGTRHVVELEGLAPLLAKLSMLTREEAA